MELVNSTSRADDIERMASASLPRRWFDHVKYRIAPPSVDEWVMWVGGDVTEKAQWKRERSVEELRRLYAGRAAGQRIRWPVISVITWQLWVTLIRSNRSTLYDVISVRKNIIFNKFRIDTVSFCTSLGRLSCQKRWQPMIGRRIYATRAGSSCVDNPHVPISI